MERVSAINFFRLENGIMMNATWMEVDEAARWLATSRRDVVCLIREGVLGTMRGRFENLVVRAADVQCLAELFSGRRCGRRRRQSASRSVSCLSQSGQAALRDSETPRLNESALALGSCGDSPSQDRARAFRRAMK